jgi:hypothetical protein
LRWLPTSRPAGVDVAALAVVAATPEVTVGGWAEAPGEPLLAVQLTTPRAAPVRLHLRYLTDRITWQASYTLIEEHGRGRLHGALSLTNRTGRRWARARFAVLDRTMPSSTPTPAALAQRPVRLAGFHAVRPGAQRLDLGLTEGGGARGLVLRPTLVYDPVGTRLDSATQRPQTDEDYGVERWPAVVDESVLVDLSRVADGPLPAGLVRVFTVAAGALVWRGEGPLLPPADDAERYTTVAVGRSPDVTGQRRRIDFTYDLEGGRLVEEVTITLHNAGERAADVLVREHLYRGECWTLAYHSTAERVAKEGSQQIGLGVTVAAGEDATVMYRVVYEWDDSTCRLSPSKN